MKIQLPFSVLHQILRKHPQDVERIQHSGPGNINCKYVFEYLDLNSCRIIELTTSGSCTLIAIGKGVPGVVFSGKDTNNSFLLNIGGESFTSRIVTDACVSVTVSGSFPGTPSISSRAYQMNSILAVFDWGTYNARLPLLLR